MKDPTRFCFLFSFLLLILSQQTFPQTNISSKQNSIYDPPTFENITIADGLPENNVTCILQDYLGYLWFGTQNGLVKYDGYSMKVFLPEKDNSNSINNRWIVTIYEDRNRTLWVGTMGGLNKFDRSNESFKTFRYNPSDSNSINNDQIQCIYEDKNGKFWVGTSEGLNLFDPKNEVFSRYYFKEGDLKSQSTSTSNQLNLCISAIIEDPLTGDLLVGTERDGLWKFNVKEKIFTIYNFNNESVSNEKIGKIQSFCKAKDGKIWMISDYSLSSLDPWKRSLKSYNDYPTIADVPSSVNGWVIEDKDGMIWAGLSIGETGLFCLNPKTNSFQKYNLFPEKPKKPNFTYIFSIYEDRQGIIWIGTWGSGIMKLDKRKNQFQVLKSDPNNFSNNLSHSQVYSVTFDPKGFIWFCTRRALDKYDIKKGIYKHYLKNEKCTTQSIYTTFQDKSGFIWIITASCGLIRFDPGTESYRFYFNDPDAPLNLVNKQMTSMLLDQFGFLWIGTWGLGLYKCDIVNNKLTNYKHDPNNPSSLTSDVVNTILEDSFGTIWVGTNLGGLNKFTRKTEKFTQCGFTSNYIIYEDKQKNFWVADYYTGLNLFDREKDTVIASYGEEDGLASNSIIGILEDDHNNLWIVTEFGLSKFNIKTRTFRNYYKEDGLPNNWFPDNQFCNPSPDGRMFFNTGAGEIVFHPDSIKDDPTPPQVVLSGISLFNRPGEKLNYKGFISELKEITLPYDQNDLRFDFVGLHFSAPERNKYKYILENFDNDWINAGTQRNATYTNLDPGEYIFRVTASNKDGVWNKAGTSIKIIILPPWWATTWAYLFYAMAFISLLYFTWKLQVKRIKVRHEFEMSRFESQKLHEVDELKSRFFTNISHEFRTPLTLILGPVKQMIEKLNEGKMKDDLSMVHRNANKLLELVNQLLDISKLESGNMKLQTIPQNIIPFLKALLLSFTSYAERKRITLKFNSEEDEIIVYLDRDKVEKIITNILSNAFKFTPDGGRIEVTLNREDNYANVIVSDTGIGIPKEKLARIFDRFYQVDGSHTREQEGTGIGLSLTKELVELHKGKIEVESEEGKGTTVTISLPLGKEHLKPEEISKAEEEKEYEKEKERQGYYREIESKAEHKVGLEILDKETLPLLLIVEDNFDVRYYIKDNLKKDYRLIEAIDGEDGWNKSIDQIPDLIVSDVMMPKMDGFKLCEKLKTDERTSHIPVILLTAKAAKQDKIEGYETGADDYIMKPFEPDELKARIKNLIEQRKRLHQHFQKKGIFEIEQSKITSVDKKFLQKLILTINKNISDTALSVEMLTDKLAISRTVLYRKIISLTGEPPGELIRRTRLNRAAELIDQNFGNLSEIALEVGFNNPAYFSESFKKQFGISPSQYEQRKRNK
jgi:signal transduction histidine kinase/ligand-binding sensor domain-containing protein/DNA-binding response OmpR family regulator